jgi:hypothetical protein
VLEFLNNLWGSEPSSNRVIVARQAGGIDSLESFPGLLKSLKNSGSVSKCRGV